jgi:hypothetical protein
MVEITPTKTETRLKRTTTIAAMIVIATTNEWKTGSGVTPTILGSDDAIAAAQSKGQITITPTNVVVNSPILQWGGNKYNTIPAGHI